MHVKSLITMIVLSGLIVTFHACHKGSGNKPPRLSGTVAIDFDKDKVKGPMFLVVARGDDLEVIQSDLQNSVADIVSLDINQPSFDIDLSKSKLEVGDKISLFAFIDNDFKGGIPKMDPGALMGIFLDKESFSTGYTIKEDKNEDLKIHINREYFAFEKELVGTIKGQYTGQLFIIAYTGEVTSLDFKNIDYDKVVAFKKFNKTDPELRYQLKILPFGRYFPIEKAYLFVIFDANGNGKPDPGEKVSYYSASTKSIPSSIAIDGDGKIDIDLDLSIKIPEVVADGSLSLSGKLAIHPDKLVGEKPMFVVVADASDQRAIMRTPFKTIKAFTRVENGQKDFSIDLAAAGCVAGDKVMIIALHDLDSVGGFPDPSPGDFLGFYFNEQQMSQVYTLQPGNNADINIDVNREVFGFEKTLGGKITGTYKGNMLVVAYAAELTSLDFNRLDFNKIIGITQFTKSTESAEYELPILPYGFNLPIKTAYVFAVFDENGNGKPDPGEMVGYYTKNAEGTPTVLSIDTREQNNIDISARLKVTAPLHANIAISGQLSLPNNANTSQRPSFVVVAKADNPEDIMNSPMESIKNFVKLAPGQSKYRVDLSQTELKVGDEIMVLALWDADYENGFPSVTAGDIAGFYLNRRTFSTTYKLLSGENKDIDIKVSREVYAYDKYITGEVSGDYTGDCILLAYAGAIDSMDFTSIDFDKVIGFKRLKKTAGPAPYKLSILPIGLPLPISNVYILAFFDQNGNGKPDPGEGIGFYSGRQDKMPTVITIGDDVHSEIDIEMTTKVPVPSGKSMTISGTISLPAAAMGSDKPVFVMVANAQNPADITANPMETIKYFAKVDPKTGNYSFDLSKTGLKPTDEIMIVGVWDRNFAGGFPSLKEGDFIGYYQNQKNMSATVLLAEGANDNVDLTIDREVYDYKKEISGKIQGGYRGKVVVFAYAGVIDSLDFKNVDFNNVVGYQKFEKGTDSLDYTLKILPFGRKLPLVDVYLFVLFDANGNGLPDGGDTIGYYTARHDKMPTLLTIGEERLQNIDLAGMMNIPMSSGNNISLSGTISLDAALQNKNKPLYLVVAKADNPSAIFESPAENIKYFKKIDPAQSTFSINLASTDLKPGDEVMVAALWDADFTGGFPSMTYGDFVGFYQNESAMKLALRLSEGDNAGINLTVNRQVFNFNKTIEGTIADSYIGNVVTFAYNGTFDSADMSKLDLNKVVAYGVIKKEDAAPLDFTMRILPFNQALPLDNVFIFALYDQNGNGAPDPGEMIATYSTSAKGMPTVTQITQDTNVKFRLKQMMSLPYPTGGSISLAGQVTMPSGYPQSTKPLFIIVAKTGNPDDLIASPMTSIKAFKKLPAGVADFSIDLSKTDLKAGDEVMILALWDLDYTVGFPDPTEGDRIGIYQNKTTFQVTTKLTGGVNTIATLGDYQFSLGRTMFRHDAKIAGKLESGGQVSLKAGDQVILVAVQRDGMTNYSITDIDSIVATKIITIGSSLSFEMRLLDALKESIVTQSPFAINSVYVYAILDANKNGVPDSGEFVGYFYNWAFVVKVPALLNIKDGTNTLPRSVGFTGITY